MANVTPILKKRSKNRKENFRPVNILMSKQLSSFLEIIMSKCQCGFRKGFSMQHCLLLMLEKWRFTVGNNEAFKAFLIDLSKAFNCLSYDLLTAKLHSCGSSLTSLSLLSDYLSNRKPQKMQTLMGKD